MSPSRLVVTLGLVALCASAFGCKTSVNPDQGRFSCAEDVECGTGWECRPQFSGGGLCFKDGDCVDAETCDGSDENCDGRTDETFPEQGAACVTTESGECAAGSRACAVGTLTCQRLHDPTAEICNGLDDDCDGESDETFDFSSDEMHCGGCFQACDAGTTCLSAACAETNCEDGLDNDLDLRPDCDDDSCFAQPCLTPLPPTWRCGVVASDGGADAGGPDAGDPDAGEPDAGPLDGGGEDADAGQVRGCFPPETDCANAQDDDGDGLTDCADLDCDGLVCFVGTQCTARVCPGPG